VPFRGSLISSYEFLSLAEKGHEHGRYPVLTDAKSRWGGFIARRDVANFLVRQITDDATPLLIG
jgi:hypothetical protein